MTISPWLTFEKIKDYETRISLLESGAGAADDRTPIYRGETVRVYMNVEAGDDGNDGLSRPNPIRTSARMLEIIEGYKFAGGTIIINYEEQVAGGGSYDPWLLQNISGAGQLVIQGLVVNLTPGDRVPVSFTNNTSLSGEVFNLANADGITIVIQNIRIDNTSRPNLVLLNAYTMRLQNVRFNHNVFVRAIAEDPRIIDCEGSGSTLKSMILENMTRLSVTNFTQGASNFNLSIKHCLDVLIDGYNLAGTISTNSRYPIEIIGCPAAVIQGTFSCGNSVPDRLYRFARCADVVVNQTYTTSRTDFPAVNTSNKIDITSSLNVKFNQTTPSTFNHASTGDIIRVDSFSSAFFADNTFAFLPFTGPVNIDQRARLNPLINGTYADDAAAGTAGLITGEVYQTPVGDLKVKL